MPTSHAPSTPMSHLRQGSEFESVSGHLDWLFEQEKNGSSYQSAPNVFHRLPEMSRRMGCLYLGVAGGGGQGRGSVSDIAPPKYQLGPVVYGSRFV